MSDNPEQANATMQNSLSAQVNNERTGNPTAYTCHQCGGVLWQQEKEGHVEFVCQQGHHCSAEDLLTEKAQDVQQGLWATLRMQVEHATLLRQMAHRARTNRPFNASAEFEDQMAARLEAQAVEIEKDVEQLRNVLETLPSPDAS